MAELCLPVVDSGNNSAMSSGKSKLGKFWQLPADDKWLVVRAAFWLGIVRIMLVVMPFRRLSERLAVERENSPPQPNAEYLGRVGFAVRAAANNVPWRSNCFPQAIAARMLLRRQGYATTIHLGVEKNGEGDIAGHAWLTCGETVVVGGEDLDRYTEMHSINA